MGAPAPVCLCGHLASHHAVSTGDTRCLAIEDRRDLLSIFDDGGSAAHAYCACLRFHPAASSRP